MLPRHPRETPEIILASSSRYREAQLKALNLPFQTQSPDIDESPLMHESPISLAKRLALAKAQAIARCYPANIVIGADQVLDLDGKPLGKPMKHSAAVQQLLELSGRTACFYSAVSVVSPAAQQVTISTCRARFRKLERAQIENYLRIEQPYDTAGSAKAEGLGIALLEELSSNDPSAIIGLPLIALTTMLRRIGIDPLCHAPNPERNLHT